jgi:hypothetical protein
MASLSQGSLQCGISVELMTARVQSRRFHDGRDMSGLPESGHGRALYEYTPFFPFSIIKYGRRVPGQRKITGPVSCLLALRAAKRAAHPAGPPNSSKNVVRCFHSRRSCQAYRNALVHRLLVLLSAREVASMIILIR